VIGPGACAPDFELPDQDGRPVRLSNLRGRTVVVYFYPKAGTPGCTKQACALRDREADLRTAGVKLLGVSPDPVAKVKRFHDEHGLPFPLLADADHAVCEAYGVWVLKSLYGRRYWGAQRATFIVREDGTVAHVIERASPKTHDRDVLAAVADVSAPA